MNNATHTVETITGAHVAYGCRTWRVVEAERFTHGRHSNTPGAVDVFLTLASSDGGPDAGSSAALSDVKVLS